MTGARILTEQSPCGHCSLRAACEMQRLACVGFRRWIDVGGTISVADCSNPTRDIYMEIFGDDEPTTGDC